MKVEFTGKPIVADDGGIAVAARIDGELITCRFSAEALEDAYPELTNASPLQFARDRDLLLRIAEQKIRAGLVENATVWAKTRHV